MNTLKQCFKTILRDGREKSRQAARKVSKLVYSSSSEGKRKYLEIANLVKEAPENYGRISEDWRQEDFVVATSVMYFLHDKVTKPDFFFPWLFKLLQHSKGYIRHAAVRMLAFEIGPLTYHIRFPDDKLDWYNLSPEQADRILHSLITSLNQLASDTWQPKYKKYKYVDSLPASPYKSIQMVLARLEESCGQKYIEARV